MRLGGAQGDPVFFELGGEGSVHGPPGEFVVQAGEERHALLVHVEHRFCGESDPNENVDTDNLRLLTVDQALATAGTEVPDAAASGD